MGFLPFTSQGFTNYFWFLLSIPSGLPINPLVAKPLPRWVNPVHSLSSITHAMTKSFFVWSSTRLSSLGPMDKGLGLSLLSLWHASGGLSRLLPLLSKMLSQQGVFPKRSYGWKPKIDFFPPLSNHTLWIPWPRAHLSYIGWVQVGGVWVLCACPTSVLIHYFFGLHSFAIVSAFVWFCYTF